MNNLHRCFFLLAILSFSGCSYSNRNSFEINKASFCDKNLENLIIYEPSYDFETNDAKIALSIADDNGLHGAFSSIARHPTAQELDLMKRCVRTATNEMTDKQIEKLYFLKTSPGLTSKSEGSVDYIQIGRSVGYRIIYGPDESSSNRTFDKDFDFKVALANSVPACLVVEDVIGLGKGYIMACNPRYFEIKHATNL